MLYSLDQVALYLNRATILIKKAKGDLSYITGKPGTTIKASGDGAEETQLLSFGSAIWIANNDDGDTLLQMALLDKLGISTKEELMEHVEKYQGRVMKTHGEPPVFVTRGMTAEELLLYRLASRNDEDRLPAERFAPPPPMALPATSAGNAEYRLAATGAAPSSGLVFVTGKYTAVDADAALDSEHAEQKLLAALSKSPGSVNGMVTISGCKMACSICEKVLEKAAANLKKRNITLYYASSYLNHLRNEVGLRKKNARGIKSLKVDQYFPVSD